MQQYLSFLQHILYNAEKKTDRTGVGTISTFGYLCLARQKFPKEYWHWSYGDRYWAFVKRQAFAMYGTVAIEYHATGVI